MERLWGQSDLTSLKELGEGHAVTVVTDNDRVSRDLDSDGIGVSVNGVLNVLANTVQGIRIKSPGENGDKLSADVIGV